MIKRLILAATAALVLIAPSSTGAYVLGAADSNPAAAPLAAALGARTYRLVMDSTRPVDDYVARVEAFRAFGMRPQIVVDGIGTPTRGRTGKNWQTINYAVRAFRRWPDSYSVSVINEPDLAGLSACQYAKTFRRAYRMLKAAGVPRVLFGEWSPADRNPLRWTDAAAHSPGPPIVADGWAWHGYDMLNNYGIQHAATIRRQLARMRDRLRTPDGHSLPVYVTEYGQKTSGWASVPESVAARRWQNALSMTRRFRLKQIVIWQIVPEPHAATATWDTSLCREDGSHRPAFAAIASAH